MKPDQPPGMPNSPHTAGEVEGGVVQPSAPPDGAHAVDLLGPPTDEELREADGARQRAAQQTRNEAARQRRVEHPPVYRQLREWIRLYFGDICAVALPPESDGYSDEHNYGGREGNESVTYLTALINKNDPRFKGMFLALLRALHPYRRTLRILIDDRMFSEGDDQRIAFVRQTVILLRENLSGAEGEMASALRDARTHYLNIMDSMASAPPQEDARQQVREHPSPVAQDVGGQADTRSSAYTPRPALTGTHEAQEAQRVPRAMAAPDHAADAVPGVDTLEAPRTPASRVNGHMPPPVFDNPNDPAQRNALRVKRPSQIVERRITDAAGQFVHTREYLVPSYGPVGDPNLFRHATEEVPEKLNVPTVRWNEQLASSVSASDTANLLVGNYTW